jgi:hypothetical protein
MTMARTPLPTPEQIPADSKPAFAITFDVCAALLGSMSKALDANARDSIGCADPDTTDPKRDAAVRFGRKVIETRGQVSDSDLKAIRDAGYGDADIMKITALVAMFLTNFINNVFDPQKEFAAVTPGDHRMRLVYAARQSP